MPRLRGNDEEPTARDTRCTPLPQGERKKSNGFQRPALSNGAALGIHGNYAFVH